MPGGYSSVPLPDPVVIERLWEARKEARKVRNFVLSDQLKHELEELGINVNQRDRFESPLRNA